ncbi:hypothetical protein F2P56_001544 [Juglans regia]|uniref:Major facilitator superfamily (MFS) profile domain-containing protein n=1 Tax=Juglans regia TaxID=51240 RepID=A0A833Y721_JUGRE|nr:hypothetical protein F2P56_001544 [Juglans regia]
MKPETMTLVLVNLASIMESADEKLVPAVYKELGAALHTDPTGLGTLTLYRSIVQTSCYPLAVYLALRYNRAHVIALGAFLWAIATFLVAISSTFFQVAVSRGLNGVGLAIVIPAIQSLVADSTDVNNRGTAFGWLYLTGKLGSITGGFFSVLLASTSFMGITGWRIAFLVVGIIIVAQGVSGSFPGSALSFAPMWLELIGFSHGKTAFLWTILVVGASFGGLFGGRMGDILAKRLPNSGRIILSQISSASAVPLAAVLLLVLPDDPSSAFMHGLVLFIMGFFTSWEAAATNNPIFAEIVPEKSRTTIYALDRTFETILASFAPYVVGILAQHVYGYKPIPKGSSNSAETETDRQNAASLAKALYTAIGIPAAICCFIYSFLYCTYPRDRERARMVALIESEMRLLEAAPSSEIDIAYEGVNSLDLDDNDDESSLLSP